MLKDLHSGLNTNLIQLTSLKAYMETSLKQDIQFLTINWKMLIDSPTN